jgi:hypothetical protein
MHVLYYIVVGLIVFVLVIFGIYVIARVASLGAIKSIQQMKTKKNDSSSLRKEGT